MATAIVGIALMKVTSVGNMVKFLLFTKQIEYFKTLFDMK